MSMNTGRLSIFVPPSICRSSVTVDYEACGYEAVRYLAEKGCREIGMINGSMKLSPCKGRYEGYKKALKESKIRVPEEVRLISLTGDVISGMLETSMTSLEMPHMRWA